MDALEDLEARAARLALRAVQSGALDPFNHPARWKSAAAHQRRRAERAEALLARERARHAAARAAWARHAAILAGRERLAKLAARRAQDHAAQLRHGAKTA